MASNFTWQIALVRSYPDRTGSCTMLLTVNHWFPVLISISFQFMNEVLRERYKRAEMTVTLVCIPQVMLDNFSPTLARRWTSWCAKTGSSHLSTLLILHCGLCPLPRISPHTGRQLFAVC